MNNIESKIAFISSISLFFLIIHVLNDYPKVRFLIQPKGIVEFKKNPSFFGKKSYGYLKYLDGNWYVNNEGERDIEDIMNIRTNNIVVTQDTIPFSYLDTTFIIKSFKWNKLNLNDRYENARIHYEWQLAEKEYGDYLDDLIR